ncbi:LysE family translocator [Kushneria sp. TE3]|uniref:LysE family translocator n=1 Tax=Kushneria sp. TE3 TaxID=3449832 RepID=UPI003F685241
MNLALLGTYVLAILMLLLTPGPVVALITGTAARHGSRQALLTVVGTNLASLVLIALAALMLAGVVSISSNALYVLGIAGSLYIGWEALCSLISFTNESPGAPQRQSARSGFRGGFLVGISNPKDILFFASLFPQFIAITQDFSTSIMTLSIIWIVLDIAILSLYIFTVRSLFSARYSTHIDILSSLFLLAVAIFGLIYNVGKLMTSLS